MDRPTALADGGPLTRDQLERRVACKYWGPGRDRHALRTGLAKGGIRRKGATRCDVGYAERRREQEEPPRVGGVSHSVGG